VNKKRIILLIAITLSTVVAILFLPSDERRIKENLNSLSTYCSSVAAEPVMETLQKAAQAARLCTDICKFSIESFNIDREFSTKEISDHIVMMKKRLTGTSFSFKDTVVNISEDGRADITTTLHLDGETVDGRFTDAYEIDILVEKNGGDWLFSSFTVVEFMEK